MLVVEVGVVGCSADDASSHCCVVVSVVAGVVVLLAGGCVVREWPTPVTPYT